MRQPDSPGGPERRPDGPSGRDGADRPDKAGRLGLSDNFPVRADSRSSQDPRSGRTTDGSTR